MSSCAPEEKDRESYQGNSKRIKCAVQSHLFLNCVAEVRTFLGKHKTSNTEA